MTTMTTRWTVEATAQNKRAYVLVTAISGASEDTRLDVCIRDLAQHLGGSQVHSGLMIAARRKRQKRSGEFLFKSKVRCERFVATLLGKNGKQDAR